MGPLLADKYVRRAVRQDLIRHYGTECGTFLRTKVLNVAPVSYF